MKNQVLYNSGPNAGQPVKLTEGEKHVVRGLKAQIENARRTYFTNETGFDIDITTLTAISKSITEQKFFEVAPADFVPVVVGEGSWSTEILKYRAFSSADDFETGIINTGNDNTRLASADAAVDSVRQPITNWAKTISWTLIELNQASRSGNWDLIEGKEKSRKKNWDLGVQKIAFLGITGTDTDGLLTLPDVNSNTTLITKYIYTMTATEFQTLLGGILQAYRSNCKFTAMPTHFFIPEADYNGLANSVDESFPLKSRLERLLDVFKIMTANPNFKILPLAYANQANNTSSDVGGKNRYTLLNYDADTLAMNIPVDYTNTLAQSINGFTYQNVGYGQFSGVKAFRAPEILYFDWSA